MRYKWKDKEKGEKGHVKEGNQPNYNIVPFGGAGKLFP